MKKLVASILDGQNVRARILLRRLVLPLAVLGLLFSSHALAATYTLSGTAGTVNINGVSCTISGNSVSCPSSVTIPNGDNLTAASSYNLSISGTLDLSNNACIGYGSSCTSQTSAINITVTGGINISNNAKVFGSLNATSGTVNLANSSNTQVFGNVVAQAIAAGSNARVFGSCTPNNAVCTQQLIAEWRMDQLTWNGTSGEVQNSVGGFYQGTAVGGAATVAGKLCQAGSFNGSTQYVSVPGLNNLLSGTASLSFWIKTTQTGNDTYWQAPGVTGVESAGTANDVFWGWIDASGRIGMMAGETDGAKSTSAINNGQWRHVVLTRDAGSGQTKVYVDGSLQSTAISQSGLITNSFSSIGRIEDTAGSPEYFNGALDELKLYSVVVSDAQVASIYANESTNKNADGSARVCISPTTCLTDTFSTGTLDTSLWNVSGVGYTPQVVTSPTVTSNRLRLTDNAGNRATFAQFKRWFPGANNKVVVEFDYFGWGGSGADGVTVVLSDASVSPKPGGFGGSLGYANRSGVDGFGGGWLGIGLDEYGNFPGTGEGRRGYPAGYTPPTGAAVTAGTAANSIAVRGSGSGQTSGYVLLANTGTLGTAIKTGTSSTDSTTKHRYRVTIDNSNSVNAFVQVERDTTGSGSSYTTVIPAFDVRVASAGQAAVPANLMLSFTGSTGGATNNHEIANVRVCATTINPVGNSVAAANFECMDDFLSQASYNNRQTTPAARNPVYTKLARTAFKLRVVPLAADGAVKTDFIVAGGSSKNVTVELFDASGAAPATCSAWSASNLVATQTATLASGVDFLTNNFTVNKAYPKLMCRVTDNTSGSPVYGCSSDQFAVRPGAVTLTTTATAAAPSASATPAIKAGANFTLRATTSTSTSDVYSGTLTQNTGALTAQVTTQDTSQVSGGVKGTLSPGSLVANAAAVNATYSEVGYLYLATGAYQDTTYTTVDSGVSGALDCAANSTSVTRTSGKYGCNIGTTATVSLGRFYPNHFAVVSPSFSAGCGSFTYMGQPFALSATVQAQNAAGVKTSNFSGVFARASVVPEMENNNSGTALPSARLTGLGAPVWTAGAYPFVATGFSRPPPPAGPDGAFDNLDIGLQVVPSLATDTAYLINRDMSSGNTTCTADPAGTSTGNCTAVRVAASAKVRFGVVRMQNAYGSDLLAMDVPVRAQYVDAGRFVPNTSDSCTALSPPAAMAPRAVGSALDGVPGLYFYTVDPATNGKNKLTSTDSVPTLTSPLAAGKSNLRFPKPSKRGWLDIILQVPPHLVGNWGNCGGQTGSAGLYDDYPCGRATFGIYKSPLIYSRENY